MRAVDILEGMGNLHVLGPLSAFWHGAYDN